MIACRILRRSTVLLALLLTSSGCSSRAEPTSSASVARASVTRPTPGAAGERPALAPAAQPGRSNVPIDKQFQGYLDTAKMLESMGDLRTAQVLLSGARAMAMQPPLTAEHQALAYEAMGDLELRANPRGLGAQNYGLGIDALSSAGLTHLPLYQRLVTKLGPGRQSGMQAAARHFETGADGAILHKPSGMRFPSALGSWTRMSVMPFARDSFEVLGRYVRTVEGRQHKLSIAIYAGVREPLEGILSRYTRPLAGAQDARSRTVSGPLSLPRDGLVWAGYYGITWNTDDQVLQQATHGRYVFRNGDITVSFRGELPGDDRDAAIRAINEAVQLFTFPTIGTLRNPFKGSVPVPALERPWIAEPIAIN